MSADDQHDLGLVGTAAGRPARLFSAFAAHAGAILQRQELQRPAGAAAQLARDNEARTALLSAVSHDLRTPLAGIKAAIGSLRSTDVDRSAEDEAELRRPSRSPPTGSTLWSATCSTCPGCRPAPWSPTRARPTSVR